MVNFQYVLVLKFTTILIMLHFIHCYGKMAMIFVTSLIANHKNTISWMKNKEKCKKDRNFLNAIPLNHYCNDRYPPDILALFRYRSQYATVNIDYLIVRIVKLNAFFNSHTPLIYSVCDVACYATKMCWPKLFVWLLSCCYSSYTYVQHF